MSDHDKLDEPIDATNKFFVAANTQSEINILLVPIGWMPKQDALLLAAYLVSMVGDDELWERTLKAVQST